MMLSVLLSFIRAGADVNGAAGKGSNGAAVPQKGGKGGAKAARANALAGSSYTFIIQTTVH
jgi:hypothetical protein